MEPEAKKPSSIPPPPPSYRPGGDEPPRSTSASMRAVQVEDDRTSFDPAALRRGFYDHLRYSKGRQLASATPGDRFHALALAVRDRLCFRWQQTQENYYAEDAKRVYYLSAEFLLGRALSNNLFALGLYDKFKTVLAKDGLDIGDLVEQEPDAGLGNGGLGRLAACFLDSMATMGLAGYGYGIRYEFGIFQQEFIDGYQVERPDEWLKFGNPWEIVRPEYSVLVHFGGRVESTMDEQGRYVPRWVGGERVLGVPHDVPVAGYKNDVVNTLRLWQARSSNEFDIQLFNDGDYVKAVEDKNGSEVISKVLYPNDHNQAGRDLRLKQEYFFVACSIADIVRRHRSSHTSFDNFAQKNAVQLNDTHPAIAVAELMRVLVDQYKVNWDKAWELTVSAIGYTNHTLLAEALEKWPVSMLDRLLPRHLQIIFEINRRFLRQVASKYPMDEGRISRMSIIEEGTERKVRMAHLAVVGAHAVNGVAALHTELLKREVLSDFADMFPERFSNKTNGVTPRRWLAHCNPRLAQAITDAVGHGWETDLDRVEGLLALSSDSAFVDRIRFVKEANKKDLSNFMLQRYEFRADPQSLFDVHIKRLHEYKRQLLNALHVVRLYLDAKRDVGTLAVPRTVLFAAKAAPGYRVAKLIIKLINSIAEVVNDDPDLEGRLKVKFLPNYGVSLAERIFPASDLSQQISTAGKEASGTGNMKFAMNGALTIGTLDGANVEIREAVGPENFFLFGLTADEVHAAQQPGAYDPRRIYEENASLKEVLDAIGSGFFDRDEPRLFQPLIDSLLSRDEYMILADYAPYVECQKKVSAAFLRQSDWHKKALTNVAHMGRFSSDRTIREYARDIWHAEPVPFTLKPYDAP